MEQGQHTTLRRILVARGLIDAGAQWQNLPGGKTNRLWKIGTGHSALVCKLFAPEAENALFPNSPEDEALALTQFGPIGLAPKLRASLETAFGACLLYQFVEGPPLRDEVDLAARALRQLHRAAPPPQTLRHLPGDRASLISATNALISTLPAADRQYLQANLPDAPSTSSAAEVWLHGDPVPANFVVGSVNAAMLIDWQCPARGDPAHDLAIFLSPAMQKLYGAGPLAPDQVKKFLGTYGDRKTIKRYSKLKALYHWQMAAHCCWKSHMGDADYRPLIALEIAALQP